MTSGDWLFAVRFYVGLACALLAIPVGAMIWDMRLRLKQRRLSDPCGGNTKGGDGCTCDPPFAR